MAARPATITQQQLQGAIAAAVKIAAEKYRVAVVNDVAIGPGTLVGPHLRLDENVTLDTANRVASDVTAAATRAMAARGGARAAAAARPALQAGVVVFNREILCGFWRDPQSILDVGLGL